MRRYINSMRDTLATLSVLATVLSNLSPAESQSTTRGERARFCFNIWAPFTFLSPNGAATGISVDVVTQAADIAGFSPEFEELPWKRCLDSVRKGLHAAVIDAAHRPDFLQGPESHSFYTNTIWVRDESPLTELSFERMRNKRMGLVDGYTYPVDLLGAIKGAYMDIEYAVDDGTNIRKLAFGRVDAIVADLTNTLYVASTEKFAVRPLSPWHSADRLYVSFNREKADLHRRFNAALSKLLSGGTVNAIYRRYTGRNRPTPPDL